MGQRGFVYLAALAWGCSVSRAAPPGETPHAVPVQVVQAKSAPVEDAAEYVATMDSRRAVELLPQVDGRVTRVFVQSGETVAAGTPLVEIDPREQKANLVSAEEVRRAAEANLAFARRQFEREKGLFIHDAISQQEFDRARTNLLTAEANVAAQHSKEKAERVQLKYYTVTAPFDGVVGDIPVRLGDQVTSQTPLTTIDQVKRLQVYVYVPGENVPRLRLGLPVRIIDTQGNVVDSAELDFISPRVERDTQTVLVKATVPNASGDLRQAQVVRARIVFATEERVVVPVVAVSRLGVQTFAFVADHEGAGLVARRRPIEVGAISGNDYVVEKGIAPGDLVIVSGIQKLADGTPVQAQPGH
jgi:RND family efflux transporter MFP subunit